MEAFLRSRGGRTLLCVVVVVLAVLAIVGGHAGDNPDQEFRDRLAEAQAADALQPDTRRIRRAAVAELETWLAAESRFEDIFRKCFEGDISLAQQCTEGLDSSFRGSTAAFAGTLATVVEDLPLTDGACTRGLADAIEQDGIARDGQREVMLAVQYPRPESPATVSEYLDGAYARRSAVYSAVRSCE